MKICISQTIVGFGPSENKKYFFNGSSLVKRSSVGKNSNNINQPFGIVTPFLATSRQSKNTSSSTYMDNNNLYQALIQTNKKIIIIKILRSGKDQQTYIDQ